MKRSIRAALFSLLLLAIAPQLRAEGASGERDTLFFGRVVAAYDHFILSKTQDESLGVAEAYRQFFVRIERDPQLSGNTKAYVPDTQEALALMREFVGGKWENTYARAAYSEYAWGTGWYVEALPGLRALAAREAVGGNLFWEEVERSVEAPSGFSPDLYTFVMFLHGNIDFDNPNDRFIVALMFFDTGISQNQEFSKIKQSKK